jgi:hypothetical protein
MSDDCVEKHQLAGLDDRARGFNRTVDIERTGTACRAVLRYERVTMAVDGHDTEAAALHGLVRHLHERGYLQLRSQLSFRGDTYFGAREPWIEYPDPARPAGTGTIVSRLLGWWRRRQATP